MAEQFEFENMQSSAGMIDPKAESRRAAARARLAEILKDPQFRAIEGFPIGLDEDILALSDPPYYTACPNPFLPEIIAEWQQEREALRRKRKLEERYQREPFAADVSEGKSDPIYNAHSYHTKVPHKAIMRYILHYTDPGDIVFDGFCGTGMTGVAAQLCGDKQAVEELGYRVDAKDVIWDGIKAISQLGARKVVLNDLSPAATFIAYNYNTPVDTAAFEREAKRILKEVEQECGWMYETWHPNCADPKRVKARINYTVWSEVLACPNCTNEIVFSDEAFDEESGHVRDNFPCPKCGVLLKKDQLELLFETRHDPLTGEGIKSPRRVPVLINYKIGKNKLEKKPDSFDLDIIERINSLNFPDEIPTLKLPDIQMARVGRMKTTGITYVRDFFLRRQVHSLAGLWRRAKKTPNLRLKNFLLYFVDQSIWGLSVLNRYSPTHFSQTNRALSGVFYVASHISEVSPWYNLEGKLSRLVRAFQTRENFPINSVLSTEDLGSIRVQENTIDYVFTDPPFGENIYYSDLNILVESWYGVRTAPRAEAIVDRVKRKDFEDYERLMEACFDTYYRSLKPGHWITVEFHNSQNSIWNAIQRALQQVGFVIADVRTLDKEQRSFQQVNSVIAVKQDLIISAYKSNGNLEAKFTLEAGTEDGVWEFVRYHLSKLPILNQHEGQLIANAERQAFLLFDRMVAFHVQRGVMVPISAPEFYAGLEQRFIPRNGMYFLPEQVTEYDRAVIDSKGVVQLSLFVTDEKTAIQWLRQQLDINTGGQPQTHADLNPKFKLVLHQARHEKAPELIEILEQNFLQDEEGKWFLPNHNKASDLERVRQRSLLREFIEYASGTGRLRQFRTEAVRAGFADAFKRQDYETIIKVAGRLPEDVLREDPDLLMYFDSATLRKE